MADSITCIVCSKRPSPARPFPAVDGLDGLCAPCFGADLKAKGKEKLVRALEDDGYTVHMDIYDRWVVEQAGTTPVTTKEVKKALVQPKPADLKGLRIRIARTVHTKIQELEVLGNDSQDTLDPNELGSLQNLIETLRFLQGAQETVEALMENIASPPTKS